MLKFVIEGLVSSEKRLSTTAYRKAIVDASEQSILSSVGYLMSSLFIKSRAMIFILAQLASAICRVIYLSSSLALWDGLLRQFVLSI